MPPKTQRSGFEELSRQGSGNVEPLDPNERLMQLNAELTQHNSRIDHWSKQRDVLQTDIAGLQATVAQVTTAVTNYESVLKDLHNRFQALEYFNHQKSKMVVAAIGERKVLIDDLIRIYDDEIVQMRARLHELNNSQNAAQAESTHATSALSERQNEYDIATDTQQDLTKKLTELESLRADITKADDTTDAASMYFLIQEFHNKARETKILSQHELSLELKQKLGELEAAKEHARSRSAALNTVQTEYTAYKTEVDAKVADRRKSLLAEIKIACPAPPESNISGDAESTPTPTPTPASTSAPAPALGDPEPPANIAATTLKK